ncbi:MAG TPA: protein kinase [Candidatus Acidoferrales bacterium]|nr:protein kinase [Candidatus Acidoferrales bacterium]
MYGPSRSEIVGKWSLERRLGQGGNGQVWLAKDDAGSQVAIKFLTKTKPIAYARFRDEVAALRLVAGVEGVLPLLDVYLPQDIGTHRPWYAMPVAVPLLSRLDQMMTRDKVLAIAQVAETLAKLHANRIAHRDIKPENLLLYKGRCHIADFGLVDYPEKSDVTGAKEQVGPRWTMAPEVRRNGSGPDPRPTDVYSLAKTLWIVLTSNEKGFDGQFTPQGELSIRKYGRDLYITPLERLLEESTRHEPTRRPTMGEVAKRLQDWLPVGDQHHEYNRLQWAEIQGRLFPLRVPTHARWHTLDDIIAVLNALGETSDLNHLLFPSGGGLDLDRAAPSEREGDCIELITSDHANIVRPIRLLFESFGDDPQWNYFRLETSSLSPTGVYRNRSSEQPYEEVTDLGDEYVTASAWEYGEYLGEPLPSNARLVTRFSKPGAFVIFQKTSIYNSIPSTYDARHNQMGSDTFRAYIAEMMQEWKRAMRKARK